ncbi:MAG: hypothetical protein PVJ53_06470 [Desulfobacterales bacterium]|jgi:hypothetical protein
MRCIIHAAVIILTVFLILSCTTIEDIKIVNHLSDDQKNQLFDSFENLDEDLWEPHANASDWMMPDFKLADITVEEGKLSISTEKGAYSKAILTSKFLFSGDFDFQIDCATDLNEKVSNMTQNLYVGVVSNPTNGKAVKAGAWIELIRDPDEAKDKGKLNAGVYNVINSKQKTNIRYGPFFDIFEGSVRLIRRGQMVSFFYQEKDSNAWRHLSTKPYNDLDQVIHIAFANYFMKRRDIDAPRRLTANFDNFKVNAAHTVIDSEI